MWAPPVLGEFDNGNEDGKREANVNMCLLVKLMLKLAHWRSWYQN